jgi:hypothetical protein
MAKVGLPDTGGQVSVSLLDGGSMTASYHKLHAGWKPESFRMYDWVFYIYNENRNQRILWDLGMSSVSGTLDFPVATLITTKCCE